MIRLLLVEDSVNLCYMLQTGLTEIIGGYEVFIANNGEDGLKAWKEESPDIIVADVEMPGMDGFEMVRCIRETGSDIPVIFATSRTGANDLTLGYRLGGDNYIKKPFIPEELNAHVCRLLALKKGRPSCNETEVFKIGNYTFDAHRAILTDENEDQQILSATQNHLLKLLCQNKGKTISREVILKMFWSGQDPYFASRSLDVFVTKLRKLFRNGSPVQIRTIKSVGLMLTDE